MRKFKCFIDLKKEENWLNQMALKGYQLQDVTFGYHFIAAKAENANIKIDFRTFSKETDFIDYCTMFEDCGWKHIAGNRCSGSQYFKKVSPNGNDDIFSDSISKACRYKRMADMWLSIAMAFMPMLVTIIITNSLKIEAIINPKLLYYTPGLWEKTGLAFWRAFLFETPFALLRGYSWLLILIVFILYVIFALKSRKLYVLTRRGTDACG